MPWGPRLSALRGLSLAPRRGRARAACARDRDHDFFFKKHARITQAAYLGQEW